MTNLTSSPVQPEAIRARSLDTLFQRSIPGGSAPASNLAVAPDLAALLDLEVRAIATGSESGDLNGAHGRRGAVDPKKVDGPGQAAQLAIADGRLALQAQPAVDPDGSIPALTRIGAILLETAPGQSAALVRAGDRERSMASPGQPMAVVSLPSPRHLTAEQRQGILSNVDPEWLRALHRQIDELYQQVTVELNNPPGNAEQVLERLREARRLLIEHPEEYVNAEYHTVQARASLERTRASRQQARRLGPRVLVYELGWVILCLGGFAFGAPLMAWINHAGQFPGAALNNFFPFWNSMMWGGIGGGIGALYHLWRHVSDQQDFDRQDLIWYLVQPVMGLVLGSILFLVLAACFLALQVDLLNEKTSTAIRLLPYLAAVLGGFRQNFIYKRLAG